MDGRGKRSCEDIDDDSLIFMHFQVSMSRNALVPRVPRIPAALAAADGMPTDSSSVDSFEDDLAMAIALKDWNQSVELVLKGTRPALALLQTLTSSSQLVVTSQARSRNPFPIPVYLPVWPHSPENSSTRSPPTSPTRTSAVPK